MPTIPTTAYGNWEISAGDDGRPRGRLMSLPTGADIAGLEFYCAGGERLNARIALRPGVQPTELWFSFNISNESHVETVASAQIEDSRNDEKGIDLDLFLRMYADFENAQNRTERPVSFSLHPTAAGVEVPTSGLLQMRAALRTLCAGTMPTATSHGAPSLPWAPIEARLRDPQLLTDCHEFSRSDDGEIRCRAPSDPALTSDDRYRNGIAFYFASAPATQAGGDPAAKNAVLGSLGIRVPRHVLRALSEDKLRMAIDAVLAPIGLATETAPALAALRAGKATAPRTSAPFPRRQLVNWASEFYAKQGSSEYTVVWTCGPKQMRFAACRPY